jgi:two-component system chemotaxis response regulator CheY
MSGLSISELSVLVVEPSNLQSNLICDALYEAGILNMEVAGSGRQALDKLRDGQYDLLISALYLPDMTGADLVLAIRDMPGHSDLAFILVSSETRFEYLDPIRQAGAVAILSKPFTRNELNTALHATLDLLDAEEICSDECDPAALEVLLVDDSRFARKHIRGVLAGMGIEKLSEAANGVEAMQLINERIFDLIITDYNMPEMDGQTLVDNIRNHSDQASVPVLMVTSEEDENRLSAVQQMGVSAICDKPFEPRTLRYLMVQIMADNQA